MGKNRKSSNPTWDRKKNAIMLNYRKMLRAKQKNPKFPYKQTKNEQFSHHEKKTFFQRAMEEYERKKAEKDRIKEMKEAKRKEKEAALKKYAEKKKEKFRKLSQKTKWGQPVMSGRMEILLEKIQKNYAPDAIK